MNMEAVAIRAFVPAKDFALSKRFYVDLGFTLNWSDNSLAGLSVGTSSFLLQKFFVAEHAHNFMIQLLVKDVESWWAHVEEQQLAQRYGVMTQPPQNQPWGIRDFLIADPTGVLWRIGQVING